MIQNSVGMGGKRTSREKDLHKIERVKHASSIVECGGT
jgi:hypothetical protein